MALKTPITNDYLTLGSQNRPIRKIIQKRALIMHFTGNFGVGMGAKGNRDYFNTTSTYASAHYCIDDHTIIKLMEEDDFAFHVGGTYTPFGQSLLDATPPPIVGGNSYSPNWYTMGIEMSVNQDGDWNKTLNAAVQLAADVLKRNNLTIDQLHRHWDITGKVCPGMMIDVPTWETVIASVNGAVGNVVFNEWDTFVQAVAKELKSLIDVPVQRTITRTRTLPEVRVVAKI